MKKILGILIILLALVVHADETARWHIVVNEDATATTYTAHFDVDGDGYEAGTDGIGLEADSEVRSYSKWIIYNGDSADTLYVDLNSTSGTQNTAVNDGTKSTSFPVPAGKTFTFRLKTPRSTISMICTAAQTCSNVHIYAVEPL